MTLADFQKYLRSLADALTAAKGSASKELLEAADALNPFTQRTMAEFARFLILAEQTYRETGTLPQPAPPPKPPPPPPPPKTKKGEVLFEQFQTAIREIQQRIAQGERPTRDNVTAELAKFEMLTKAQLDVAASEMGFKARIKSKKEIFEKIAERLRAGFVAEARAQV